MNLKITSMLAAFAFAASTLAPVEADARHRRGDGYHNGRHYDHRYDRRHRHDDDGDAVVAGVVGLALGLALGSMASQSRERRSNCYDNYRYCEPPQRQQYYEPSYDDRGYYEDSREAYERDYSDYNDRQCTRQERQWDRYANRYVTVDVPC